MERPLHQAIINYHLVKKSRLNNDALFITNRYNVLLLIVDPPLNHLLFH